MTQHITTPTGLIGILPNPPRVYRSENKRPFASFHLTVTQQRSDTQWYPVPQYYTQRISVYGPLVNVVESLKAGHLLQLEGRIKEGLWVDQDGMQWQSEAFITRGLKVLPADARPAYVDTALEATASMEVDS